MNFLLKVGGTYTGSNDQNHKYNNGSWDEHPNRKSGQEKRSKEDRSIQTDQHKKSSKEYSHRLTYYLAQCCT